MCFLFQGRERFSRLSERGAHEFRENFGENTEPKKRNKEHLGFVSWDTVVEGGIGIATSESVLKTTWV